MHDGNYGITGTSSSSFTNVGIMSYEYPETSYSYLLQLPFFNYGTFSVYYGIAQFALGGQNNGTFVTKFGSSLRFGFSDNCWSNCASYVLDSSCSIIGNGSLEIFRGRTTFTINSRHRMDVNLQLQ
jgi:hypothetical protein